MCVCVLWPLPWQPSTRLWVCLRCGMRCVGLLCLPACVVCPFGERLRPCGPALQVVMTRKRKQEDSDPKNEACQMKRARKRLNHLVPPALDKSDGGKLATVREIFINRAPVMILWAAVNAHVRPSCRAAHPFETPHGAPSLSLCVSFI